MVRIRSKSKDVSKNINRMLIPLVRLCKLRVFLCGFYSWKGDVY